MSPIIFNLIIALLSSIIVLLIAMIVRVNLAFHNEQKLYNERIQSLHHIIAEISERQAGQNRQLQLSETFDDSLRIRKSAISTAIFALQYELFDLLSKNKLLKKK